MADDGLTDDDAPIHVPNVQRIKRASGRVDLYFRKGDYREGPLANPDGTQALLDEVKAIITRLDKATAAAAPRPGTVGAALDAYTGVVKDGKRTRASDDFLTLAASTQIEYQRLADEIKLDAGSVALGDVDKPWLRDMRSAWAERGYKAANDRMQVLKNALEPAIEDGRVQGDPFHRLKKVRRPHDLGEAHPTWHDAETHAAIELAIARKLPGLARAIALGRYGGFRRGTICAMPVGARINGFDDHGQPQRRLQHVTEKRTVLADKPEDARLTALLARTPNRATTIAYNQRGYPWKERQLNQAITRLVAKLAESGKARPNLTIHGLRHARGVELAMAGASDAEIMSDLAQATDRAAKIYRRQADRRKLADQAQAKVDNVVRLRTKKAASKG